jgi:hypothetical protein
MIPDRCTALPRGAIFVQRQVRSDLITATFTARSGDVGWPKFRWAGSRASRQLPDFAAGETNIFKAQSEMEKLFDEETIRRGDNAPPSDNELVKPLTQFDALLPTVFAPWASPDWALTWYLVYRSRFDPKRYLDSKSMFDSVRAKMNVVHQPPEAAYPRPLI